MAISRKLPPALAGRVIYGRAGDQELGASREARALHGQGFAGLRGDLVGDGIAGAMEHDGAQDAVAQFGIDGQLRKERDRQDREGDESHLGLPGGVLVTV